MTLFDPSSLGTITRLAERDGWTTVYIHKKRTARLPTKRAAALGIAHGVEWTATLAAAAALATETVKAKKKAVALLKLKDRTTHELRDRLTRAGFEPEPIEAALAELTHEKLLNDQTLARTSIDRDLAKGRSIHAAAQRLATRGINHADIPAPAPTPGKTELDRAIAAAKARAAKLPQTLPPQARARRLLAALARLGYEEDTARDAAARVLGFADPDQDPL
jgi:regulatory protein